MGFFTYSLQNYWIIVQIKTKITLKPCLSLFLMCLCKGCLKEGCELIGQALALFTNVYGALHQDVCVCLRLLGRIHYILGEYAEVSHVLRYDWSSNKYDKKQLSEIMNGLCLMLSGAQSPAEGCADQWESPGNWASQHYTGIRKFV